MQVGSTKCHHPKKTVTTHPLHYLKAFYLKAAIKEKKKPWTCLELLFSDDPDMTISNRQSFLNFLNTTYSIFGWPGCFMYDSSQIQSTFGPLNHCKMQKV